MEFFNHPIYSEIIPMPITNNIPVKIIGILLIIILMLQGDFIILNKNSINVIIVKLKITDIKKETIQNRFTIVILQNNIFFYLQDMELLSKYFHLYMIPL